MTCPGTSAEHPKSQLHPGGTTHASLTLLAQEEGVEAQVVDAQVQPALAGHAALPAAARVICDQLLGLREVEPGLELHQGLAELLGLLFLLGQPAARLLGNQSLAQRRVPGSGKAPGPSSTGSLGASPAQTDPQDGWGSGPPSRNMGRKQAGGILRPVSLLAAYQPRL